MIRLVVSRRAEADLSSIIGYLSNEAGTGIARAYLTRFQRLNRLLVEQPDLGSPRPLLGRGVRMSIVAPYLVFYRRNGDQLSILRILHGRRKITNALIRHGS